jgi:hypothetical protein
MVLVFDQSCQKHSTITPCFIIPVVAMHTSPVIQFSLFIAITLAVPSSHHLLPRQNATTGPCDPWSPTCQPVRQSNACLAQFLNRANDSVILRCVDDQDAGQAKVDVSGREWRGGMETGWADESRFVRVMGAIRSWRSGL